MEAIRHNTVTKVAFKDISYYTRQLRLLKENVTDSTNYEKWVVSAKDIFTPKNKELNRKIGLHKVNKINNVINFKK